MADILGKVDEVQAKIKAELALFLANQSVLINLRKGIQSLQSVNPATGAALSAKHEELYARQGALETKAIDWMSRIGDLKGKILTNPDISNAMKGKVSPSVFSAAFWSNIAAYTNAALPLINEGIAISAQLVTQNGDVALLKKSVEQGRVLVPTVETASMNQGLIWAYGLLGLGLAYLVSSKKRAVR